MFGVFVCCRFSTLTTLSNHLLAPQFIYQPLVHQFPFLHNSRHSLGLSCKVWIWMIMREYHGLRKTTRIDFADFRVRIGEWNYGVAHQCLFASGAQMHVVDV